MEEARVELIHWRERYSWDPATFVVMWSDGTWEEFQLRISRDSKYGKTYKQRLDLQKIIKKPRSFAIDYIERKRKELS